MVHKASTLRCDKQVGRGEDEIRDWRLEIGKMKLETGNLKLGKTLNTPPVVLLEKVRQAVKKIWEEEGLSGDNALQCYQPELDNGTRAIIFLWKRDKEI